MKCTYHDRWGTPEELVHANKTVRCDRDAIKIYVPVYYPSNTSKFIYAEAFCGLHMPHDGIMYYNEIDEDTLIIGLIMES